MPSALPGRYCLAFGFPGFGNWTTSIGHKPKGLRLPIASSNIHLDLYVPTRSWIVEAKRSASRAHVRTAIGQVPDYAHITRQFSIAAFSVVLFPSAPAADLTELIHSLGIILVYQETPVPGSPCFHPEDER